MEQRHFSETPEARGSIFTSCTRLTNRERRSIWSLKYRWRHDARLFCAQFPLFKRTRIRS